MSPNQRRLQCALAIVVILLVSATHASAAVAPLTLGEGDLPGVGIDSSGNAYVGWRGPQDAMGVRPLMFCRVPKGAGGCDGTPKVVAAPGTSESYPAFVVTGTRVVVAQSRTSADPASSGVFLITSMDGGNTFGPARNVGQSGRLVDAVAGPGETISVVGSHSFNLRFENIALGAVADEPGFATLSDSGFYSLGAVDLDGATPLVLLYGGTGHAAWSRYDGGGSMSEAANWSSLSSPFYLGEEPGLAGGPLGLFATGREDATSPRPVVRRLDAAGFGPSSVIEDTSGNPSVEQDSGGRLHAVYGTADLKYAVSDDGVNWRSAILVQSAAASARPRLAVTGDHTGAVVYRSGEQIRLAWLASDAAPAQAGPGGTPPPPPSAPPPPAPPPPAPPPPAPPAPAPAAAAGPRGTPTTNARKSINVAGGRVTLTAPRTCVPPRRSFVATLASTRARRARFLAISRAGFYVDGRRRALDRKTPFKQRILPAGVGASASHTLKARATIRLRGSKPVTRTISVRFRYCST